MADKTTVSTNVDTFNDGGSYLVRTEVEARLVSIHGPFPDLETAKKLQASQTAYVKSAGEGLKEQLAARGFRLAGGKSCWLTRPHPGARPHTSLPPSPLAAGCGSRLPATLLATALCEERAT